MKKTLLAVAVALVAMTAGAQAQEATTDWKWVGGGTANFKQDKEAIADNYTMEGTLFRIEPFVGYQINDRWRAGLTFGYGFGHQTENYMGVTSDYGKVSQFRVGPYVHFDIVKYNRWILWAEAEAFYIWSPATAPMDGDPMTGSLYPATSYGRPASIKLQAHSFTIKPGITYVLDKHVNIDFNLNLLGWYYTSAKMKVLDGGSTSLTVGDEMTSSHHGLVLDMLESTPSDYWQKVAIGITFKF